MQTLQTLPHNNMTSIDLYDQLVKNANRSDLESQRASRHSHSENNTDQFQILVKQCRKLLDQVRQNNSDIISFKDRLVNNTRSGIQAQISQQLRKLCDDNYAKITQLREKVIGAGKIVQGLKEKAPNQPQTFSKIYRKQHLAQQVDNILRQSYTIQKIIEKFSIDTTLKRIRIVLPQVSQSQAKDIASKPKALQMVMKSKMVGKASNRLKNIHADIMSKAQGIAQLQSAVQQNLKLMKQVALLVQQQGQMIDNIYTNVTQAKDYIKKAQEVLVKQKKQHKKSRKKMCCIIFIGLLVLALILTPIIITVVKNQQAAS